ncbi:uncharacterized protein TRAVEDRAFT_113169, partial [Trametes versicolor FP-101664 SS1]|uniref:uncharacterized protein n=1 Tax=Trametes versicolor (strain FP-101664) TaxID=717944 RepID=UPI00046221A5
MFTAFNILQRRAVLLNTGLKVRRDHFKTFASRFASVSDEAIARVCTRVAETGLLGAENAEERKVVQLMKEVQLVNRNVPGSSASRVAMRNEIRALMATHGMPSFYLTINPADIYSPVVKLLAGADIDIDRLLPEDVPDPWEQSILVARNPVIAAKFFNVYIKAFIK